MNTKLIMAASGVAAILLIAPIANADQVIGTLSSNGTVTVTTSTTTTNAGGGNSSLSGTVATSSGGSLTGTVNDPTLTGTVVSPSSGGGSGGGGGGGGGNGPIAGSLGTSGVGTGEAVIPTGGTTGEVLGASTGPTEPTTPGTPNTGAGGNAAENLLVLLTSAGTALAGLGYLRKTRLNA